MKLPLLVNLLLSGTLIFPLSTTTIVSGSSIFDHTPNFDINKVPSFKFPALRGIQGTDDQTMSNYAQTLNDNGVTLTERYQRLDQDLQPSVRRYNFFWSGLEDGPAPSDTPFTCPSTHMLVPANETDRIKRKYLRYHCYNTGMIESFDDLMYRDAQIGSINAFIMYGSPDYAMNPACTGFPWGPNMYRQGCLPWNNLEDWYDYVLFATERWSASYASGKARLSGLVLWNEVQSQGWADPSPVLPNRYDPQNPWSEQDYDTYAGFLVNMTIVANRAATINIPDITLWLSTDHFSLAPPLNKGDVYHIGLNDLLDRMWPQLGLDIPLSIAVHPYDAGDPRQNLTSQGIYTFGTLKESVYNYQCNQLVKYAGILPEDCFNYPQVQMYASEQGWPYNNVTMNKTLQARNICYAHGLSLAQNVWAVTHNFFQSPVPTSQGDAGDFSLIDEPPVCFTNLTTCAQYSETYQAYMATAPGVYGVYSNHYCCTRWNWGCTNDHRTLEELMGTYTA